MRLALGTAQFGLDYGVANTGGRTPFAEVESILDTPADFAFVERIFTELLPRDPFFGWRDVLALVEAHPEIAAINS